MSAVLFRLLSAGSVWFTDHPPVAENVLPDEPMGPVLPLPIPMCAKCVCDWSFLQGGHLRFLFEESLKLKDVEQAAAFPVQVAHFVTQHNPTYHAPRIWEDVYCATWPQQPPTHPIEAHHIMRVSRGLCRHQRPSWDEFWSQSFQPPLHPLVLPEDYPRYPRHEGIIRLGTRQWVPLHFIHMSKWPERVGRGDPLWERQQEWMVRELNRRGEDVRWLLY